MPKNFLSLGTNLSTLSLPTIHSSVLWNTVEGHWQVTIKSYLWFYCSSSLVPSSQMQWNTQKLSDHFTDTWPDLLFYDIFFLVICFFEKLGNKYNLAAGAVSNSLPWVYTHKGTNKKSMLPGQDQYFTLKLIYLRGRRNSKWWLFGIWNP